MFAGIGGFRAGLERAGGFRCIGHSEIDKHADAAYRRLHKVKESEVYYADATKIKPREMPEFDLLCAGFPCQAFSIAGRRQGFADPRGTLFFTFSIFSLSQLGELASKISDETKASHSEIP